MLFYEILIRLESKQKAAGLEIKSEIKNRCCRHRYVTTGIPRINNEFKNRL